MPDFMSVGQVAQEIGGDVRPRDVSDLLYQRRVDLRGCVLASGRWLVPRRLLGEIRRALAERAGRRQEMATAI